MVLDKLGEAVRKVLDRASGSPRGAGGESVDAAWHDAQVLLHVVSAGFARAGLPLHALQFMTRLANQAQSLRRHASTAASGGGPEATRIAQLQQQLRSTPSSLAAACVVLSYASAGELGPALSYAAQHKQQLRLASTSAADGIAADAQLEAVRYASLYAMASSGLFAHVRTCLSQLAASMLASEATGTAGALSRTLTPYHWDLLVTAAAASGGAAHAETIIATLLHRNVALPARSFNTLIRAYAAAGNIAAVREIGKAMLEAFTSLAYVAEPGAETATAQGRALAAAVDSWDRSTAAWLRSCAAAASSGAPASPAISGRSGNGASSPARASRGSVRPGRVARASSINLLAAAKTHERLRQERTQLAAVAHSATGSFPAPAATGISSGAANAQTISKTCTEITAWIRSHSAIPATPSAGPTRSAAVVAAASRAFAPAATAATFVAIADAHAAVADTSSTSAIVAVANAAAMLASEVVAPAVAAIFGDGAELSAEAWLQFHQRASGQLFPRSGRDDGVDYLLEALRIRPASQLQQVAQLTVPDAAHHALMRAYAATGQATAAMSVVNDLTRRRGQLDDDTLVEVMQTLSASGNLAEATNVYHDLLLQYTKSSGADAAFTTAVFGKPRVESPAPSVSPPPGASAAAAAPVLEDASVSILRASRSHAVMLQVFLQNHAYSEAERLMAAIITLDTAVQQRVSYSNTAAKASASSKSSAAATAAADGASGAAVGSNMGVSLWAGILRSLANLSDAGVVREVPDRMLEIARRMAQYPIFPHAGVYAAMLSSPALQVARGTAMKAVEALMLVERSQLENVGQHISTIFAGPSAASSSSAAAAPVAALSRHPISLSPHRGAVGCAYVHSCIGAEVLSNAQTALEYIDNGGFEKGAVPSLMDAFGALALTLDAAHASLADASPAQQAIAALKAVDPRVPADPADLSTAYDAVITQLAAKGLSSSADRVCAEMAASRILAQALAANGGASVSVHLSASGADAATAAAVAAAAAAAGSFSGEPCDVMMH